MKLLAKTLAFILVAASAVLGILLLKQETSPEYISVYDSDDDLF